MKHTHPLFFSITLAACAALLSGCGKSEPAAGNVAGPVNGVRTIEITANDSMKFSLAEIRAVPGEKLRISFTNLGRLPKSAMGHNWVLIRMMSAEELQSFTMIAATTAPEYLPADRSAVLAHTKLLGPSESDTIEITVPMTPGDYPFLCTFPGHASLMRGKLVVGPAKP